MAKRDRLNFGDPVGEGESCLTLKLSDIESLKIGDTRVHLNYIYQTGVNGGRREVSLTLIGPRDIRITRVPRPARELYDSEEE